MATPKPEFDYAELSAGFVKVAAEAERALQTNLKTISTTVDATNFDTHLACFYVNNALHGRDITTKTDLFSLLEKVLAQPAPTEAKDVERYSRLVRLFVDRVYGQLATFA